MSRRMDRDESDSEICDCEVCKLDIDCEICVSICHGQHLKCFYCVCVMS